MGPIASWGGTAPPSGHDYVAISAGNSWNLALRADGSLAAAGNNYSGQLDVPEGNDYVAIDASGHGLALKADGSLVGWGWNLSGQSDVPSGNDFLAVSAGGGHSVALIDNGVA